MARSHLPICLCRREALLAQVLTATESGPVRSPQSKCLFGHAQSPICQQPGVLGGGPCPEDCCLLTSGLLRLGAAREGGGVHILSIALIVFTRILKPLLSIALVVFTLILNYLLSIALAVFTLTLKLFLSIALVVFTPILAPLLLPALCAILLVLAGALHHLAAPSALNQDAPTHRVVILS